MFEYARNWYGEHFDHAILAVIGTVSIVLFLIGGLVELAAPFTIPGVDIGVPPIAAAFLAVFGVLAAAIVLVAYAILYMAKLFSLARDRTAPT